MDEKDWTYYRELEKRLIALDNAVARLAESNKSLERINGFIFGAILMEITMLLFNWGR